MASCFGQWEIGDGLHTALTDSSGRRRRADPRNGGLASMERRRENALGGDSGTILHTTDAKTWKPLISATKSRLYSVYSTKDGKSVWAAGSDRNNNGVILHSTDGETWTAQSVGKLPGPVFIRGLDGGRSLWVLGSNILLHSRDGKAWESTKLEDDDGRTAFRAVFSANDGKSLWALDPKGIVMRSSDGLTWREETKVPRPEDYGEVSVYTSDDGRTMWYSGTRASLLHGVEEGHRPYLNGAAFERTLKGPVLRLSMSCPDQLREAVSFETKGRNKYKIDNGLSGFKIPIAKNGSVRKLYRARSAGQIGGSRDVSWRDCFLRYFAKDGV